MSDDPYEALGTGKVPRKPVQQVVRRRRKHSADGPTEVAPPITDPGMWHFRAQYMSAKAFAIFRDHP